MFDIYGKIIFLACLNEKSELSVTKCGWTDRTEKLKIFVFKRSKLKENIYGEIKNIFM